MKNLLYINFVILLSLLLSGCEKEDRTYQGPQYYEFSAFENRQGTVSNILQKENNRVGLDSICIQLIKTSTGNVTVNYEIVQKLYYLTDKDNYVEEVPAGTDISVVDTVFSTAVHGQDYVIVTGNNSSFTPGTMKGSLTIPKGEYFGYIQVNMLKKTGKNFYVVLKDSPDTKANKPTSILNYKISPDKIYYFTERFHTEIPDTWTLIDKDGDGYNWEYYKSHATSDSYRSGGVGALTPENYLVSPLINIGSTMDKVMLTFDISAGDEDYPEENYRVVISESPITLANCREATILRDWTELDASYASDKTETIDITQYKGKSVYIAFVHGNCTDCYYIRLANVNVFGL